MTDKESPDRREAGDAPRSVDAKHSARSLRARAEEMLKAPFADVDSMSMEDVRGLLHELRVHQMELEIQNEDLRESQLSLAQSRDGYSDLYDFAPVGYLTLDRLGVIQQANLTAASLLGVERRALLGTGLAEFVSASSQDDFYRHRRAVFATDDPESGTTKQACEVTMQTADGRPLAIRLESRAIRDEETGLSECRTALIDLTVLKQGQQQVKDAEQRWERLADAIVDYMFTVRIQNGETVETIHGPNCEAITGYTPAEFAADENLWITIVPPEDRPLVDHHIRQTLAGKHFDPLEHRMRRKDGMLRWVSRAVSPQLDDRGRLIAYDGLLRDITEKKVTQDAVRNLNIELDRSLTTRTTELQQSIARVALLTEAIAHLGEGVLITNDQLDPPGPQIVFVNEAMCRISGYSADELLGQSPRVLHAEKTSDETRAQIRRELSAGNSCSVEVVNYRKDGTPYDAELFITPLFDAAGQCTSFVSIHRDITDRKQAAQRLHDREQRLAAILNTASDAIITIDQRGIIEGVNAATGQMFGFTSEELIGKHIRLLMPPPFSDEDNDYVARYIETGEARIIGTSRELTGRRKDGSTFPIDLAVSRVDHLGLFAGIVRDISERKRLELEVLEIAETERHGIGQDLHDDLGQQLGGLGMLADALAKLMKRQGRSDEQQLARQIQQGLKQAGAQVRALAYGLVPIDVTSHSLADALCSLTDRFNEPEALECSFDCPDDVDVSDNQTATQMFRIAQEAAANAVRHGLPHHIRVTLEKTNGLGILTVHDDGSGFDILTARQAATGVGLRSMEYRASQIGGHLTIESQPGEGTTVKCTVLLDEPQ